MWATRRKKTKIVKETLDPTINKIGFPAMNIRDTDHGNLWVSKICEGDLEKEISVQDNHNILKLALRTNAYGQEEVYALSDKSGMFASNGETSWYYKDLDSFKNIVSQFIEPIEKYALVKLDEISLPTTDARPTIESNRKLYNYHEELYIECIDKWNLINKSTEEICVYLDNLIIKNQGKQFKDIEPLLIKIAAVFGTQMIQVIGGKWVWDNSYKHTFIVDIGPKKSLCYILNTVIGYWRDPILYQNFMAILQNKG